MKPVLSLVLVSFFASTMALPLAAQTVPETSVATPDTPETSPVLDAFDVNLADFFWKARVLVIFADTRDDPRVDEQLRYVTEGAAEAVARDLVVVMDTDPAAQSATRTKLRPRGFAFALLDKDGSIIIRKASPWHMREISRLIDKTTIRQEELRRARGE